MAIRGPHPSALLNMAGGFLTPGMVVPPVVQEGMVEAVDWSIDAVALWGTLAKQNALGSYEMTIALLKGEDNVKIAEIWDRNINDDATAHAEFSRKHEFGAMSSVNGLALLFASIDTMKRRLLQHYIWGQGKLRTLSGDEMRTMVTYFDLFDTAVYSQNMKSAVSQAIRGQPSELSLWVKGANDALGNFAIDLEGVVKPTTDPPRGPKYCPYELNRKDGEGNLQRVAQVETSVPLVFEGWMTWRDDWDFDSKMAARVSKPGSTGRPTGGELQVAAVASLVDGVPFKVTSHKIKITQFSGHAPIY